MNSSKTIQNKAIYLLCLEHLILNISNNFHMADTKETDDIWSRTKSLHDGWLLELKMRVSTTGVRAVT